MTNSNSLELKQFQKQVQKLSPLQIQTIKLLELPTLELEQKIQKEIEERDYRDTHRETSPLRQAEDAVLIDSSGMSIDEVKEEILKLAKERL
jgi:cytidylate kinase